MILMIVITIYNKHLSYLEHVTEIKNIYDLTIWYKFKMYTISGKIF